MAPMPQAALVSAAVYYPPTSKIYVFGGSDRDLQLTFDVTQIYDIATNTWSAGQTMPGPRSQLASGYNPADGKIYLNGGYETAFIDSVRPTTWAYDPVGNSFAVRADSPAAQGGPASEVINGHLYIAGGRTNPDMTLDLAWDYNIATDAWQARASMPTAKNVPGRAVGQGQLYAIGGGNPFTTPLTTTDVVKFDPGSNTWSTAPALNAQRSFTAGASIGNTLFAAGGRDGATTSIASVEKLVLGGGPVCPAGSTEVDIGDNFFDPQTVNIPTGGTVCWTNTGQAVHTVTSDTGVFDSGPLDPGEIYSFTFTTNGTYDYHCNFHLPTMTGQVVVGGAATSTSTTSTSATTTSTSTTSTSASTSTTTSASSTTSASAASATATSATGRLLHWPGDLHPRLGTG